ncbi:MAG: phospholipase D-like domain-containing protein [Bacteroidia bacterium]|nr:phospholipase D-like domain-containing protein [Bacteroidia bacterium]
MNLIMHYRRYLSAAALLLLLSPLALSQTASNVVISEFATRGGSIGNQAGEFIELYNPTGSPISMAGWRLEYQSASGSSYSVMATVPPGTVIRARSFFLCASPTWAGTPVADLAWSGSGMADNGNIRLVNAGGQVMDRVGYGSGNNPEGQAAPNHGTDPNDHSLERKANATSTAASLAAGGSDARAGNGWDSNNNAADFVLQSNGRNPQNSTSPAEPPSSEGSGSAAILRGGVNAGDVFDLPISFRPSKEFTIEALAIVVPADFPWSRDIADVTLDDNMQADAEIRGDTLLFARVQFAADSAVITLRNMTAPGTTGNYLFTVLTGMPGMLMPVEKSPALFVKGGPIPIAEARANDTQGVPLKLNDIVTVNGIVTVANQFGSPSYIQDHTGGIAVYDFNFSGSVAVGDEVTVTGKITHFNGLTELVEVTVDARPSTGNELTPLIVPLRDVLNDGLNGVELYESMLVRINGVTVNTQAWTVTGSGTNYKLSDGSAELEVRIDNDVALANQPAPGGSFDIVGVVSQFKREAPFAGGYQFMPRMLSDVIATGPRIVTQPVETDIQPDRVSIGWSTGLPALAAVRYGRTSAYELGVAQGGSTPATEQTVTLAGLEPATIYRVQPFSVGSTDTSFAQPFYISSASRNSSGDIIVSFNQSADNTLYPPLPANSGVNLLNRLLNRIDAAQHSIDLCLYSLSGPPGEDIVDRLIAAKNRGVRIRAIVESDNSNSNAMGRLRANVPTIQDNFDRVNAGVGLQHNKFVVLDARDRGSDTDDWVLTGSWNPTEPGTYDDAQNVIEIQDQALANTFTKEFEEMWGGSGETAVSDDSRFGARKLDNTPHRFVIGPTRIPVELYFSPSDNVSSRIVREVQRATSSVLFALLTFTRDDIARAMLGRHNAAVAVRGVMDNSTDQGSRYDYLLGNGMDVWLKKGLRGMLHHKYLLVNAGDRTPGAASVLTGSHNWSNAAEFSNNENTLILRDADIAVQYLQEWYKRYRDAGGEAVIVLDAKDIPTAARSTELHPAWPNPVPSGAIFTTSLHLPAGAGYTLSLHDALGRRVAVLEQGNSTGMLRSLTIGTAGLPAGIYFLRLLSGDAAQTVSVVLR